MWRTCTLLWSGLIGLKTELVVLFYYFVLFLKLALWTITSIGKYKMNEFTKQFLFIKGCA